MSFTSVARVITVAGSDAANGAEADYATLSAAVTAVTAQTRTAAARWRIEVLASTTEPGPIAAWPSFVDLRIRAGATVTFPGAGITATGVTASISGDGRSARIDAAGTAIALAGATDITIEDLTLNTTAGTTVTNASTGTVTIDRCNVIGTTGALVHSSAGTITSTDSRYTATTGPGASITGTGSVTMVAGVMSSATGSAFSCTAAASIDLDNCRMTTTGGLAGGLITAAAAGSNVTRCQFVAAGSTTSVGLYLTGTAGNARFAQCYARGGSDGVSIDGMTVAAEFVQCTAIAGALPGINFPHGWFVRNCSQTAAVSFVQCYGHGGSSAANSGQSGTGMTLANGLYHLHGGNYRGPANTASGAYGIEVTGNTAGAITTAHLYNVTAIGGENCTGGAAFGLSCDNTSWAGVGTQNLHIRGGVFRGGVLGTASPGIRIGQGTTVATCSIEGVTAVGGGVQGGVRGSAVQATIAWPTAQLSGEFDGTIDPLITPAAPAAGSSFTIARTT